MGRRSVEEALILDTVVYGVGSGTCGERVQGELANGAMATSSSLKLRNIALGSFAVVWMVRWLERLSMFGVGANPVALA